MTIAALRTLAVLEQAAQADTVFGGKTRTWSQLAAIWVDLSPLGHRESGDAGLRPSLTETAKAQARDLSACAQGQRLICGGEPWRVVAVEHAQPKPGRMTLKLERSWS